MGILDILQGKGQGMPQGAQQAPQGAIQPLPMNQPPSPMQGGQLSTEDAQMLLAQLGRGAPPPTQPPGSQTGYAPDQARVQQLLDQMQARQTQQQRQPSNPVYTPLWGK